MANDPVELKLPTLDDLRRHGCPPPGVTRMLEEQRRARIARGEPEPKVIITVNDRSPEDVAAVVAAAISAPSRPAGALPSSP